MNQSINSGVVGMQGWLLDPGQSMDNIGVYIPSIFGPIYPQGPPLAGGSLQACHELRTLNELGVTIREVGSDCQYSYQYC